MKNLRRLENREKAEKEAKRAIFEGDGDIASKRTGSSGEAEETAVG